MRHLFSALAAITVCFIGASTASAQRCHDDSPHTRIRQVFTCGPIGVGCEEACECVPGYHADGTLDNGDPRCVRDAASWGSYADPLCATGATRGSDGECMCPESLGARGHRTLTIVSRSFAESISDTIENYEHVRAHGRTVALMVCIDPTATGTGPGTVPGVLSSALDQAVRILCAAPEGATDEQLLQACRDTRTLIDSIRPTIIHYAGNDYSVQDFVDGPLAEQLGNINQRLSDLESTVREHGEALADHETRISALEHMLRAIHVRFGGFGLLGGELSGPITGAGGASGELLVRFGDLPVGLYGRLYFGGQSTAWDVGSSFYLGGGAGFTYFTGGRADTTLSLGYYGDTLLDPYMATHAFPHDSLGTMNGAQLLISLPLPGDAHIVRIEAGLIAGYAERRLMDQNNVFRTPSDAFLAGTLGIVIQPD